MRVNTEILFLNRYIRQQYTNSEHGMCMMFSFPTWPISAGPTLQSVYIRLTKGYQHCDHLSSSRRRLKTAGHAAPASGRAFCWRWSVKQERDTPYINTLYITEWARGGAVNWGTALQAGRSRVRFPRVSLEFFIDIILPAALWSWGWLSSWQKWVPGIFPEGLRRPVHRANNVTIHMCRLSWNLRASTSCNPQGLSRPLMRFHYLLYVTECQ